MHCFPRRFRVSHHIGSNSNPGMTQEESNRPLDSDVLHTVTLLKQKKKTSKAGLRPFFIDVCHSASANENRAFRAALPYNVVITSSGFDWLLIIVYYFQIWNKKEYIIIISKVFSSHMGSMYTETPYISSHVGPVYTETPHINGLHPFGHLS